MQEIVSKESNIKPFQRDIERESTTYFCECLISLLSLCECVRVCAFRQENIANVKVVRCLWEKKWSFPPSPNATNDSVSFVFVVGCVWINLDVISVFFGGWWTTNECYWMEKQNNRPNRRNNERFQKISSNTNSPP